MQNEKPTGETREQLKLSHQRVTSLFNSLPGVCAIVDDKGIIFGSNPAIKTIFSYEQKELVGENIRILLRAAPWGEMLKLKDWYLANPDKTVQVEGLRKDGKTVPVDISVREYMSQDLFVVMIEDVSERVKLERMKQEFFDMVSHDMRSPLSSIALSVDLLQDNALPEEALDQLKRVSNNVKHLIRLINDLLDIEKVEAGQIRLLYEKFSIAELAAEAIEVVRPQATKRKLTMQLNATEADLIVCADKDRILRVLINLLGNAIKFSPKGGRIDLSIIDFPEYVEVSIKDDGRGIPVEMQESIFERFTQVVATDATKKGGSGLGLAICKGFIDAHNGKLKVESETGKGSRFYFQLPHKDPPSEQEGSSET